MDRKIAVIVTFVTVALLLGLTISAETTDAGEEGLSLASVTFDDEEGILTVSGTSDTATVKMNIVGDNGYVSPYDSFSVIDGKFSGTYKTGKLDVGTYTVKVFNNEQSVSQELFIGITIDELAYSDGVLSIAGSALDKSVKVSVTGEGYCSPFDSFTVMDGKYSGQFRLDLKNPGTYSVKVFNNGYSVVDIFECKAGVTTGLELKVDSVTIDAESDITLEYDIRPVDSTDIIQWKSMDETIVTVDNVGHLKAEGFGTTEVVVTAGSFSDKCTVNVITLELKLTPQTMSLYVGDDGMISVEVPKSYTEDQVYWESSDENIVSVVKGRVSALDPGEATVNAYVAGLYAGKTTVRVIEHEIPTEVKEFTFFLKMEMDWDKADFGRSNLTENELKEGITIKGSGTNAGEALENACDIRGIPNEFISTHDGNNNDLRYWVIQIFGLGTVALEDGDWKYWVQEYNGSYNQKTLGWYTDNSGVYSLRYDVTSVDYGNVVERIYVKEQPTKTTYEVGESFDPAGMVVMAEMSAGEDLQVFKYDIDPEVFRSAGDQKVTLTYRGQSATVDVTVTGDSSPDIPPVIPDIPLDDEKTETNTEKNEDGSTTTTTTTTGKTEDGKDVEIKEVVKTQEDGSSEGTKTQTVTGKDGSKAESTINTVKDKNGNVTETVTGTSTDSDGNVTKVDSVSELDKDGNGKTESTTKVTNSDGSTMTKKMSAEKSKDGTEINESVVAESKDGNVRTETVSKVDRDGNVQAESRTTVKSGSKDIGADVIEDALRQSEQALFGTSADKSKAKKTVEVEVAGGTTAALSPEAVKKVSDYGAGLTVTGNEGSISADTDMLRNLAGDGTKSVELSMEVNNKDVLNDKQKDVVGDNLFIDLNALVGGENVHQLGGKAVITFGYQLKDGESASDLKVYYVDDDGIKTFVDATYADGNFTMTVDHFSVYMVEHVPSDDGGISPVLIAGILVVVVAVIAAAVLYTRKH